MNYYHTDRKWIVALEEPYKTFQEARARREELIATKEYFVVKTSRVKVGLSPCKYNNFTQAYAYSVRAYNKPTQ